jgi:hypothetical protein
VCKRGTCHIDPARCSVDLCRYSAEQSTIDAFVQVETGQPIRGTTEDLAGYTRVPVQHESRMQSVDVVERAVQVSDADEIAVGDFLMRPASPPERSVDEEIEIAAPNGLTRGTSIVTH